MFNRKLSSILGTFTKAQTDLTKFLTDNSEVIAETRDKLADARGEQDLATQALKQIKLITGDK